MATEKDVALVNYLFEGSKDGNIKWEATASEGEFTTSFKGKYNVSLQYFRGAQQGFVLLSLTDAQGRSILTIDSDDIQAISGLYNLAQRAAYNVDAAIDEIMTSSGSSEKPSHPKDEDIPF